MATQLIHDGYTRDGFIASVENDPNSLTFSYRPMLPEDVDVIIAECKKGPPRQATRLMAATMAEHLVSWDATDATGKTAAIELANVGALPWRIFQHLYNIITGLWASDPLPKASKPESDDMLRRLRAAAGDGKPAGLAATVADRKN